MEQYDIRLLAAQIGWLTTLCKSLEREDVAGSGPIEYCVVELLHSLPGVRETALKIQADKTLISQIDSLNYSVLDGSVDSRPSVLRARVDAIRTGIMDSLRSRMFMHIPSDQAAYYDNHDIMGPEVRDAFPSSSLKEIVLAGNCYAAGLWTASVVQHK